MDPRERYSDTEEAIRSSIEGMLTSTWCGGPGIIEDYDATTQRVSVQPAVMAKYRKKDGTLVDVALPLLLDVCVQFPYGGNYGFTFPVAKGDECYFAIADRCVDAWWQNGDVQPQAELRLHDLSDAFAFLGFRSKPRLLSNVSTTTAQLRSDDYSGVAGAGELIQVGPGKIVMIADEVAIVGRTKLNLSAAGCGIQYLPNAVNTFTDGVGGSHSAPTPPEIAE